MLTLQKKVTLGIIGCLVLVLILWFIPLISYDDYSINFYDLSFGKTIVIEALWSDTEVTIEPILGLVFVFLFHIAAIVLSVLVYLEKNHKLIRIFSLVLVLFAGLGYFALCCGGASSSVPNKDDISFVYWLPLIPYIASCGLLIYNLDDSFSTTY